MRFFRALLFLYPRYFRREYHAELTRSYEQRVRGRSAPSAWLIALAEAVPGALLVRWDHLRQNTAAAMTQPTLFTDVRVALRQMRCAPLFSAVVVAVLGLGIGINTGLLTLLDTFAWQPAPGITRAAPLARLLPLGARAAGRSLYETRLSSADLAALRERRDVFAGVAAWGEADVAADFGGGAELVTGQYVTGNYFSMLGVRFAAGRGLGGEGDPATAQTVVIGWSLWQEFFLGADSAVGASVRIMGVPFTIVGVTPREFTGVDVVETGDDLLWVPLAARALLEPDERGEAARRTEPWLDGVGQLVPGVRPADVARLTGALTVQLARQRYPDTGARLVVGAERLAGMASADGGTRELVAAFFLVAALVVVITCTNVGALLLGRAVARRREIAIRLSLGATRLRLVRQLLTEALVFALAGAALGIALFAVAGRVLYATVPDIVLGLTPRPVTVFYASVLAVVATVAMGLVPALTATRADIGVVIKSGGHQAVKKSRLQAAFVVAQLASSQPVLVVSALVLASMSHIARGGAAPAPATIVSMSARVLRPAAPDSVRDRENLLAVTRRLMREPGVRAAAVSVSAGMVDRIRQVFISPEYFAARDMPLLRGRGIGDGDVSRPVAVVNELAARMLFPGEQAVGNRIGIRLSDAPVIRSFEVVGLTREPAYDVEQPRPALFLPLGFAPGNYGARLVVRTRGDARAAVPRLREAIREAEPYAAITGVVTVAEHAAGRAYDARVTNVMALLISATALLLASLGLYAIIAYAVAQRTREIGVRLAIGAAPTRVVREFFTHGMKVSAVGLAIGLPLTLAGIRLVEASLLGFTLRNVLAVLAMVPVLLGVAALASWLPARRAGRVDPLIALQRE